MKDKRIIVIADDITGAAEMAGIAHRLGLRVELFMSTATVSSPKEDTEVIVIATDTRSMTETEAVKETQHILSLLSSLSTSSSPTQTLLFKKTDSALRGHVMAELEAILNHTDYQRALYIPANPSKGRIIRDGIYYIHEEPIHQTDFSFDPEFPAISSVISERFPTIKCSSSSTIGDTKGIFYTDATSKEDIQQAVNNAPAHTLFAGAADLFETFLFFHFSLLTPHSSLHIPHSTFLTPHSSLPTPHSTLIICGSTQSKPIDCGISTSYMPTSVYDGKEDASTWTKQILLEYRQTRSMILAIKDTHRNNKESAVYLRHAMAETAHTLISAHCPKELIIEGGATAFAILQKLKWHAFTITHEIAPGVIRMQATNGTIVTLKPGSYPWGGLF